jgi:hypothetical protein
MNTLNHTELALKLSNVKSSFIGLKTETAQSSLNKGRGKNTMVESIGINPDEIKKLTSLVGLVGTGVTYQDMVNNRLAKENADSQISVTFEASELPWGEWVKGAEKCLLKHNGKFYLRVYCVSNNKPKVSHIYEGAEIDIKDSKFEPWKKAEKSEGENQGLENPIVVRTYGFESIKEITLGGETFQVVE